jgi:hypothetical protein
MFVVILSFLCCCRCNGGRGWGAVVSQPHPLPIGEIGEANGMMFDWEGPCLHKRLLLLLSAEDGEVPNQTGEAPVM